MKITDLKEIPQFEAITELYDKDLSGVFISDMVSDVMAGASAGSVLVTVQIHKNMIAAANLVDISAIIITQGKKPNDEVKAMADKVQISLLSTSMNGWQVAQKLYETGLR